MGKAEPKGVVESEGKRYKIGHHPNSGWHIQEPSWRKPSWRTDAERWQNSRIIHYTHDRAVAERWLARLVEVGRAAMTREYYDELDRQYVAQREAREVMERRHAEPFFDLTPEQRKVVEAWANLPWASQEHARQEWRRRDGQSE